MVGLTLDYGCQIVLLVYGWINVRLWLSDSITSLWLD